MSSSHPVVPVAPTDVAPLLAPLHTELLSLLGTLTAGDWERPTRAGSWRVRDVAAHLLDDDLRKLSFHRDGRVPPAPGEPIASYRDLVAYINRLNADGVRTAERLSPRLLVDLLAFTGPQVAAFVESLPPEGKAIFGVAWAGQETSPNWLDTGREYTERWHHQQQIREAVEAPLLRERRWLHPVLDISVRALPFTYRDVEAPRGTSVRFEVTGDAGGDWSIVREDGEWRLFTGAAPSPAARVTLTDDTAWRLFFKGISPAEAAERIALEGEDRLGRTALGTLAVMA